MSVTFNFRKTFTFKNNTCYQNKILSNNPLYSKLYKFLANCQYITSKTQNVPEARTNLVKSRDRQTVKQSRSVGVYL